MSGNNYNTFAFISYSHRDIVLAKWLQRRLEGFRLPTGVHNDIDLKSRYLRPIFRDESDLNPGILSNELKKHLSESKFLILICSRHSAESQWVSEEAKFFVESGRLDRIIPVIVSNGEKAESELFPIYLREYFSAHPEKELLGVNIREAGREKALVRVVSKMLDVSFDSLWKRHQRQRRIRMASYTLGTIVAAAATYLFAIPVDVAVEIRMEPSALPTAGRVTLTVDGAEYSSAVSDCHFDRISIPGYKRFSSINVTADAQFFNDVDSTVATGYGLRRDVGIVMTRDDSFAWFAGHVYDDDMEPVAGVTVSVAGVTAVSDADGRFAISLPLRSQLAEQQISLEKPGYTSILRDNESPSRNLKFIIHKER